MIDISKIKLSDAQIEEVRKKTDDFISRLNQRLSRVGATAVIGGSAAKGTMVKDDFDCDIFVKFKKGTEDISEKLGDILGDAYSRVHGSRDYFQIQKEGINFELVPVLDIRYPAEAENVTDMSPLHVNWVKERIKKNPKLTDEILKAKVFCKAQRIYGAESFIGGFSGHVLDILIVYYGSFESLLKNSQSWARYKVIDVEGHDSYEQINESKISPLIVIDPVDRRRNAAAALSFEKFSLFKQKASEYLKSPSDEFFKKKEITVKSLKKQASKDSICILGFEPLEGKIDVIGSKIKKVYQHIGKQLVLFDFTLIDDGWDFHDRLMWFITKDETLPKQKEHMGPPVAEKERADSFKKKHPEFYEREGRLYVMLDREFRKASDLIRTLISAEYCSSRAKTLKMIV